jgi:leader peptidase (prepilin peptidase)/N-methyltransferase
MGLGDAKLAAMVGFFLGWPKAVFSLFLAVISGGIVAAFLLLLKLKGRKDAVPFGPFISLGAIAGLLGGEAVFRWYVNVFIHSM